MRVVLDTNSLADYKIFIRAKGLPRFKCTGHEVFVPDEYAHLLEQEVAAPRELQEYVPLEAAFDYQKDIARLAIRKRKFAVFMRMGLGKTIVDYEFARYALEATKKRTLIVCPLMVLRQMIREYDRFYPTGQRLNRVSASELQGFLDGSGPLMGITNCEALREGLHQGNLGTLVISDSSWLASMYGKWGARAIELGKGLEWKLCDTGTPAPNDRIEYANHAVILDAFPTTNAFLAKYFVNRGQTENRWEMKPHATGPFYRDLSHWCIFVDTPATYGWKDNVGTIPPINVYVHDIELTQEQNEAVFQLTGCMFLNKTGGIVQRSKLSRISKGEHNGKKITTNKTEFIQRLIDSWPEESTILWVRFNKEQDDWEKIYPEAASISGDTPYDRREELIDDFKAGRRKILISKAACLGLGLNLQVATRHVFGSFSDSYRDFVQMLGRSNRVGSTMPLNAHIVITELERPMLENTLRKAKRVQEDTEIQERMFKERSLLSW
jgi:hypothetical protein